MQRYSKLVTKTSKSSKTFDTKNATYLTKAGYIDQLMAGVYTYLPLGYRVLNKIEKIVREEMDKIAQEIYMPAISPKDNWQKSNRLGIDVLLNVIGANEVSKKRNNADYILNPTHEDIVTPLVQKFVQSYKELPVAVYQIQSKFRNEARPKSGLLRGREFRMKDLYSFHGSKQDLMEYYEVAKQAYIRVYERLGIGDKTIVALASGGDFTQNFSHEFQTKCEIGEDLIFFDKEENTYYNKEVAPSKAPKVSYKADSMKDREDVFGKGIIGVEEIAEFLKIPVEQTTKTLIFNIDEKEFVAVAVRGGYEVDEGKLKKVLKCKSIRMATPEEVKEITGTVVGYVGIIALPKKIKLIIDESCDNRLNFETGANKENYHSTNVNWGKDVKRPDKFYDIKVTKPGDLNPRTNKPYDEVFSAAEVGNIFPLEVKFSQAFEFMYKDDKGNDQIVYMGSYGIGTSRLMGVIAEIMSDEKGLCWPEQIAPYDIHLVTIGSEHEDEALKLIEQLEKSGKTVLWDDRPKTNPGEKFADADLIGIPNRLILSKKSLENGGLELTQRSTGQSKMIKISEISSHL